jgi:hypothetical protein
VVLILFLPLRTYPIFGEVASQGRLVFPAWNPLWKTDKPYSERIFANECLGYRAICAPPNHTIDHICRARGSHE